MQDRPVHFDQPARGGSSAKKIILGIVIGVVVLGVGCIGTGAFIVFKFSSQVMAGIPDELLVTFDYPETATAGETISIVVTIENTGSGAHTLDSIDIYDDLTAGLRIQSSAPAWNQSMHIMDFTTYDYQLDVPGNGTRVVTFTARALTPGDYMGDVDICVNSEMACESHVLRTIVADAAAEAVSSGP